MKKARAVLCLTLVFSSSLLATAGARKAGAESEAQNPPTSTVTVNVKMEDFQYNRYLIDALDDQNVGIRTSAALLLKTRLCRDAKDPLMKMLKNDKEYVARIIAGLTLMDIGDEESLVLIEKQAKIDKNLTVRHVLNGITQEMNKRYMANK
jgi:HEAT repeat protein